MGDTFFVDLGKKIGMFGPLDYLDSHGVSSPLFQIPILIIWLFGFFWIWMPIQMLADGQEALNK